MEEVGRIAGFFAHPSVAVIELTAPLRIGDLIYVKGHTTDFQQRVESLQVDQNAVQEGLPAQRIGLKVSGRCRKHDLVYKLVA
jgi:putative protease